MSQYMLPPMPQNIGINDIRASVDSQVADAVTECTKLLTSAKAITIESQEMYEIAVGELRNIKTIKAKLEDRRKEFTKPLDTEKRFVMDAFERPTAVLDKADDHLSGQVLTWSQKQEEIRRNEQARRSEQARKEREEAEERQRQAQEEASAAIASGDESKAETASAKASEAENAVAVAEVKSTKAVSRSATPAGIGVRKTWSGTVTDMHALVKAAAADPALLIYLLPDETRIGQYARMMKDQAKVPGITFEETAGLSVRKKA